MTRLKLLLERYGKIQIKHGMLPRRALEKQVLLLEVTGQTPGASWRCNSRSAVSSIAGLAVNRISAAIRLRLVC